MPSWTKDQEQAINLHGGKVIVSAAAGSGKTAVLSERVIKYVLDGGSINRLLIVTFTDAAAKEMKLRIKEKINDLVKEHPWDARLKKELLLSETARITTMDAFYSEIVKNNFEKLNINRNFKILSNEEERMLSYIVVKEVMEDAFELVPSYDDALSFFGASNVDLIKDIILKTSSFLDTLPFKDEFIKLAMENYDEYSNTYKNMFFKLIKDKMKQYDELYQDVITELYEDSCFDKMLETAKKEKNFINDFLNINTFDGLSKRLRSISFDTLRTPKGHKDDPVVIKYKIIRDDFKDEINKKMHELMFINDDVYESEKALCKKKLLVLFKVVSLYLTKLMEEKRKQNAFSFSDVAHFVIDLLIKDGKKTPLAISIMNVFDEILIDEYQDTNNLQNVIFNAISKDNKNLFIVGDVKQSIYRFRSACPEIFNNDKKKATNNGFPRLINLAKNFRSRKEVLDFCNFVFENTMSDLFGEVSYDDNEKLYLGASFEEGDDLSAEVHIIDGAQKIENDEEDISKSQKEATYVAEKIKIMLEEKNKIYDNKKRLWREIKPSDIVILLRSLKDSDCFIKALNQKNISVYCESTLSYFDNYEVKLVINILKVIDNPNDDVALLSVLKSPCFNVSLDDVSLVRKDDKKRSLKESILSSNIKYLKDCLQKINDLQKFASNNKIEKLLAKVYDEFDLFLIMLSQPGGKQRKKNLVQMLTHAINFEKDESKSLHEFTDYLETLILNKDSLHGVNPLSDGDNVLITTIHKSKGLEYPVVFVCQTGKSFNFTDVRSDFMINQDLGICFPIRNDYYKLRYDTVMMMLFKDYEKSKMLSEELRVLYVALTRAKEKIIITGYANNLAKMVLNASSKMGDESLVSNLYLKSCKSYLEILLPCLLRHKDAEELRLLSSVSVKTFPSESRLKLFLVNSNEINSDYFNEKEKKKTINYDFSTFKKLGEFSYDNSLSLVPETLSVSSLKNEESYFKKPKFMTDDTNHAKKGTLYHLILELLPVKKYNLGSLKHELEKMVLEDKITSEEKSKINLEKIFSYLTSDIYDMVLSADKVYKEYEINFKVPAKYYDSSLKSGKILINGVIDLLFVKDNTYYVVDYKTDNVLELEELVKRYKLQLDLYELGLKEITNAKVVKKFIYSIKLNKFIEV